MLEGSLSTPVPPQLLMFGADETLKLVVVYQFDDLLQAKSNFYMEVLADFSYRTGVKTLLGVQ